MARRKSRRSQKEVATSTRVAVVLALIAGVPGAVGGIGAAVIAASKENPPALSKPCVELYRDYQGAVGSNPGVRVLLEPGPNGEVRDPQARYCGLNSSMFPTAIPSAAAAPPAGR